MATAGLAVLVAALTHDWRRDADPEVARPLPVQAVAAAPLVDLGTGGSGGAGTGGGSGGRVEVSQDEYDARVMLQLAKLDVDKEREIYRFLERNGAGMSARSAAESAKLVESLYRLRGNENPAVRCGALAALGRITENSVGTEPFLGFFDDPEPRVRREAVIGRTRHGISGHWSFVMPLVRDPEPSVRVAVAYALGTVDESGARAALLDLYADSSDDVMEAAATAIGRRLRETPPPAVFKSAKSERYRVRLAAVRLLRSAGTPECVPPLAAMIDDPVWEVRREVIRALASFTGAPSVEVRVRVESVAFDATRTRTERFEALQVLAHTESEPDADRIEAVAAADPDPALRLAAALTLLARRDPRACATLADLLETKMGEKCDDEDRMFVCAKAAQTLRDVSGAGFKDGDVAAWKKLVPGLEARVREASFEYMPDYMIESW